MLRHYIKMAMRHLLKNKIQNLISIVGLSVGILCFSICLYCSRFISEVDSCFSNKELIADINLCTTRGDLYSGIPATTIEELRKLRFDEVQDFTFTVCLSPRAELQRRDKRRERIAIRSFDDNGSRLSF